jgi:hypothetical protein
MRRQIVVKNIMMTHEKRQLHSQCLQVVEVLEGCGADLRDVLVGQVPANKEIE